MAVCPVAFGHLFRSAPRGKSGTLFALNLASIGIVARPSRSCREAHSRGFARGKMKYPDPDTQGNPKDEAWREAPIMRSNLSECRDFSHRSRNSHRFEEPDLCTRSQRLQEICGVPESAGTSLRGKSETLLLQNLNRASRAPVDLPEIRRLENWLHGQDAAA